MFESKLLRINDLQQQIDSFGKLPDDVLKKINYKFRLEWNYTSNSMEGNTLTKEETRSVMIGNITVHGKPIKDVLDIKGHDEVITRLLKIGKGELNLSETRIREMHSGIMHEEDPTKQAFIGKWKTSNNYVINYKGERFDYKDFSEAPELMHNLVNWLNTEKEKIVRHSKDALHPVVLALKFHLEFVTIHPFYDGNGRMARILTNLILIAFGYPPLYIKENEKDRYSQYIADIQGYGGSPDVFFDFIADAVIRSQELVLKGIAGEEIEEPEDWEKKLNLLKAQTTGKEQLKVTVSAESVNDVFIKCVQPLVEAVMQKLNIYDELFAQKGVHFYKGSSGRFIANINEVLEVCKLNPEIYTDDLELTYRLYGYNRNGKNLFDCHISIKWTFEPFMYYTIFNKERDSKEPKFYDEFYSNEEINQYVNKLGDSVMKQIEQNLAASK